MGNISWDLHQLCDNQTIYLNFALKCLKHPKHSSLFPKNEQRKNEKFHVNFAHTGYYQKSAIPYCQNLLNKHFTTIWYSSKVTKYREWCQLFDVSLYFWKIWIKYILYNQTTYFEEVNAMVILLSTILCLQNKGNEIANIVRELL